MTRFLILGGYGYTGKLLARHLLERSEAEIILAGRNLEKARLHACTLNAETPGERVSAVFADASDKGSLLEAMKHADMIVVAAPTTRHTKTVISAVLEANVDYLDVQLDARKIEVLRTYTSRIKEAGRCFITEAGFHPGLPSAMVRYAAARLDRIDSAIVAGYLNMGHSLPFTDAVDELMEVFKDYQAQVYRHGAWTKPGMNDFDVRTVDFGRDIGKRKCYSMFFEELRGLPEMYPSLRDTGFYMSQTHWLLDWIITPIVFFGLKLAPRRGVRPLGRLMWWGMQTLPKPPYRVVLKVEARGEKDGTPRMVDATVEHADGYELTAIPVVAFLLQYIDGSARPHGVSMMGHAADPVRLFADMEKMGVRVTTADS